MLKSTKNFMGSYDVIDPRTNDPVATIKKQSNGIFRADWHPVFLKMNPSVAESWRYKNAGFHNTSISMRDHLTDRYLSILNTDKVSDPLDTKFKHVEQIKNVYGATLPYHVYGVHHNGQEVGDLKIPEANLPKVGINSDSSIFVPHPEYKDLLKMNHSHNVIDKLTTIKTRLENANGR